MPTKSVVTFGEIMLRLSAPGFARFTQSTHFNVTYGGGEANVANSLAHFGIPSTHVTRFPANDLGKAATQFLQQNGVNTQAILYGGDRLGIYFVEAGASSRASRVLYDRDRSSFAQLEPGMIDWEDVLKEAQWFHWTGITPAISEGAALVCQEAIQIANRKGITVSADVNYRKNLWQYGKTVREVMPKLIEGCDLIIASENDAADIFGISAEPGSTNNYMSVCQQLQQRFPRLKQIVTTHRGVISSSHNTLSAVLWNGREMIQSIEHTITPIVDRIGGGDAFMAGLIYGLLTYQEEKKALDFGLAASVLKHTIEGDVNLVTVLEVEALVKGENIGRLVR
ncbi:MAG: sugar kinase [Bacteroidota bacterium]